MNLLTVFHFEFENENAIMELLELGKNGFTNIIWSNGESYLLCNASFYETDFSLSNKDIFSLLHKTSSGEVNLEHGDSVFFFSPDEEALLVK